MKDVCWNFRTMYGGQELSRNRVVIPEKEKEDQGHRVLPEAMVMKVLLLAWNKAPKSAVRSQGYEYE